MLRRRHRSLLHPERRRAPANGRAGLRNLSPLGSYTGRGRIRFLGSAQRDCSSIFATARPPSKSGAAAYRRLRHRLLHSVSRTVFVPSTPFVFSKAKTQYVYCCLIQFFIMFAEMIMIWLCLVTSMIGLFMLVLIMFMIYLFWNLIKQLSIFQHKSFHMSFTKL